MDDCYLRLCEAIIAQAKRDYEQCIYRLKKSIRKGKGIRTEDIYMYQTLKAFWKSGANKILGDDVLEKVNEMFDVDSSRLDEVSTRMAQYLSEGANETEDTKYLAYNRNTGWWRVRINKHYYGASKTYEGARALRDSILEEGRNYE